MASVLNSYLFSVTYKQEKGTSRGVVYGRLYRYVFLGRGAPLGFSVRQRRMMGKIFYNCKSALSVLDFALLGLGAGLFFSIPAWSCTCSINGSNLSQAQGIHGAAHGAMGSAAGSAAAGAGAAAAGMLAANNAAMFAGGAAAGSGMGGCEQIPPIAQGADSQIEGLKSSLCKMDTTIRPPMPCPDEPGARSQMEAMQADLRAQAASAANCGQDTGDKQAKNDGNGGKMPSLPSPPGGGGSGGSGTPLTPLDPFDPFVPTYPDPTVDNDKPKIDEIGIGQEKEVGPTRALAEDNEANPFNTASIPADVEVDGAFKGEEGDETDLPDFGSSNGGSNAAGGAVVAGGGSGGFGSSGSGDGSDADSSDNAYNSGASTMGDVAYGGGKGGGRPSSVMALEGGNAVADYNSFLNSLNAENTEETQKDRIEFAGLGGDDSGADGNFYGRGMASSTGLEPGMNAQDGSSLFAIVRYGLHQAFRRGDI